MPHTILLVHGMGTPSDKMFADWMNELAGLYRKCVASSMGSFGTQIRVIPVNCEPHSAHRSPDIRTSQELVRWSLNLLLSRDPPCGFLAPTCQKGQDLPLVLDGAGHLFGLLRGEQVVA
jgi:hypothetical protein